MEKIKTANKEMELIKNKGEITMLIRQNEELENKAKILLNLLGIENISEVIVEEEKEIQSVYNENMISEDKIKEDLNEISNEVSNPIEKINENNTSADVNLKNLPEENKQIVEEKKEIPLIEDIKIGNKDIIDKEENEVEENCTISEYNEIIKEEIKSEENKEFGSGNNSAFIKYQKTIIKPNEIYSKGSILKRIVDIYTVIWNNRNESH